MRSQARALVLVFLSLVTAMVLGVASAFVSAQALGATALIVPGTGTPDADIVDGYRENAWSRYIDGVVCTDVGTCSDPDLVGIPYPASFWPLSFIPDWCVPGRCDKWNVSVDEGADNLMAALKPFLDENSDEEVFIFGYSQGGAVVSDALTELAALGLSEKVRNRLQVVTIGGIENPDGGLWQRLSWLQYLLGNPVPILDVSFDPAMPVDAGIRTTTIGFEYDPVVFAPKYWGNAFAVLNMIAAFDEVHPYYLAPNAGNENPMPYGYTDLTLPMQLNCAVTPANCRTDDYGNSYIMIPATSLPLTNLIRAVADSLGVGWLAKPFVDLVEPVVRELVDLGFDCSGNPGVSSGSTILPFKIFQNWLKVGLDFAIAAVKGVEAFVRNFIPAATATGDTGARTALAAPVDDTFRGAGDAATVTPSPETAATDAGIADDAAAADDDVTPATAEVTADRAVAGEDDGADAGDTGTVEDTGTSADPGTSGDTEYAEVAAADGAEMTPDGEQATDPAPSDAETATETGTNADTGDVTDSDTRAAA